MQQVKSEAFLAGARVIDPRALPVPVRSPRHKLANNFSRAWVLHRRTILRGAAVAALLVSATAIYELREPIGVAATTGAEQRCADRERQQVALLEQVTLIRHAVHRPP